MVWTHGQSCCVHLGSVISTGLANNRVLLNGPKIASFTCLVQFRFSESFCRNSTVVSVTMSFSFIIVSLWLLQKKKKYIYSTSHWPCPLQASLTERWWGPYSVCHTAFMNPVFLAGQLASKRECVLLNYHPYPVNWLPSPVWWDPWVQMLSI